MGGEISNHTHSFIKCPLLLLLSLLPSFLVPLALPSGPIRGCELCWDNARDFHARDFIICSTVSSCQLPILLVRKLLSGLGRKGCIPQSSRLFGITAEVWQCSHPHCEPRPHGHLNDAKHGVSQKCQMRHSIFAGAVSSTGENFSETSRPSPRQEKGPWQYASNPDSDPSPGGE